MDNRKKVQITYADQSVEVVWVKSLTEIQLTDKMVKVELIK